MTLVHTDYRGYQKQLNEIKQARNRFQVLLDLVADVLTVSDINQLRYISLKGRDGLFDKLQQQIEQPEISGMPISTRAAVQMLDLPDLEQLDQAAEKAKQHKEQLEFLDLEAGEVILAAGTEDTICNQNSTFAKSESELDLLEAMVSASKALTRLQETSKEAGVPLIQDFKNSPPLHAFQQFFQINGEGAFEVNAEIFRDIQSNFRRHIPRRRWK
jgi:hypothetical protein